MMSLLVINLLTLFFVSFLQDILSAYYLRLVTEERIIFATFISFIHSLVSWGIWLWFVYQFQNPDSLSGLQAVFAAFGSAMGTFFGLRKTGHKAKVI